MRIIDLFSGAGGLTFGFYYRKKGNRFVRNRKNSFVFANEFDSHAAKAFSANYPDINMLNQDIKTIDEETIVNLIGEDPVDLIIGGPPCQSFSTVGQRVYDEKAMLYEEYLRILSVVRPKMFLFENVKGILSMKEAFYKTDEDGNIVYKTTKNKETGRERKKAVVDHYGRYIMDIIKEIYKYLKIPYKFSECKNICSTAKLLYGRLLLLEYKHGYIHASNNYLATIFNMSERSFTSLLSILSENNFITIGGRDNFHRKIYLSAKNDYVDRNK